MLRKFPTSNPVFAVNSSAESLLPLSGVIRPNPSTVLRNDRVLVIDNDVPNFGEDIFSTKKGLLLNGNSQVNNRGVNDFSKWTAQRCAHKVSNVLAPDRKSFASTLIPTAVNQEHYYADYDCNLSAVNNAWYSYSMFIKAGLETKACMRIGNATDLFSSAFFDLITGQTNITGADKGDVFPSMRKLYDGWWHCSLRYYRRGAVGSLGLNCYVYPTRSMTSAAYLGDDVSEAFYIWGCQYENGYNNTSLIGVEQEKPVRAADRISFQSVNLNLDNFAIVLEFGSIANKSTGYEAIAFLKSNSDNSTLLKIEVRPETAGGCRVTIGNLTLIADFANSVDKNKFALSVKKDGGVALFINGVLAASGSAVVENSTRATYILLGDDGSGFVPARSVFNSARIYLSSLTDAELKELTRL